MVEVDTLVKVVQIINLGAAEERKAMDGEEQNVQEAQDVVSQDQVALDAEQGAEATPAYISRDDHVAVLADLTHLRRELSGLQGKQDRALNSIRRETEAKVEERVESRLGELQRQQGRKEWWNSLDEDQQRAAEPLVEELEMLRQQMTAKTAPAPQAPAPAQTGDKAFLNEAARTVERFGLKWDDPNVRYGAFNDPSLTPEQQAETFAQSIRDAILANGRTNGATPPRQTANPPVEAEPQNARAVMRSADDIRDAYIQGTINTEDYKHRMQAIGEPV
jgi:hypothetical protein